MTIDGDFYVLTARFALTVVLMSVLSHRCQWSALNAANQTTDIFALGTPLSYDERVFAISIATLKNSVTVLHHVCGRRKQAWGQELTSGSVHVVTPRLEWQS
jgi:hypothetical protein